jgi:hypothetical protein
MRIAWTGPLCFIQRPKTKTSDNSHEQHPQGWSLWVRPINRLVHVLLWWGNSIHKKGGIIMLKCAINTEKQTFPSSGRNPISPSFDYTLLFKGAISILGCDTSYRWSYFSGCGLTNLQDFSADRQKNPRDDVFCLQKHGLYLNRFRGWESRARGYLMWRSQQSSRHSSIRWSYSKCKLYCHLVWSTIIFTDEAVWRLHHWAQGPTLGTRLLGDKLLEVVSV